MNCPKCDRRVPQDANYCSHCGEKIEREIVVGDTLYGIFYPWGESYTTSLALTPTEAEVLTLLNSVQSPTVGSTPLYLAELQLLDNEPKDDPSLTRLKVVDWWIIKWDGMRWIKKMRLLTTPNLILLSSLESE